IVVRTVVSGAGSSTVVRTVVSGAGSSTVVRTVVSGAGSSTVVRTGIVGILIIINALAKHSSQRICGDIFQIGSRHSSETFPSSAVGNTVGNSYFISQCPGIIRIQRPDNPRNAAAVHDT